MSETESSIFDTFGSSSTPMPFVEDEWIAVLVLVWKATFSSKSLSVNGHVHWVYDSRKLFNCL